MKKLTAFITALAMLVLLCSCAGEAGTNSHEDAQGGSNSQSDKTNPADKSDLPTEPTEQEETPTEEAAIDLAQALAARQRAGTFLIAPNNFIVGLNQDGTVNVAIGSQYAVDVSYATGWTNVKELSADSGYIIGLTADGKAIVSDGLAEIRPEISTWSDLVQVSAGSGYMAGLRSDGTVVLAKYLNVNTECDVSDWKDMIAVGSNVSGGASTFIVGLKKDGTVEFEGKIRGLKEYLEIDVSDWEHIIAISAGASHFVGLKDDGTVVAAGYNTKGECDVSDWEDIIAVSAGAGTTLGLRSDGTVVAAGDNLYHQCDVSNWTDIVAISAGYRISAGLKSDGSVVWYGQTDGKKFAVSFDFSEWGDTVIP